MTVSLPRLSRLRTISRRSSNASPPLRLRIRRKASRSAPLQRSSKNSSSQDFGFVIPPSPANDYHKLLRVWPGALIPEKGAIGMKEIVFEGDQEADGGFTAEALGESIFTQADSWDELKANVREAVRAFYFDSAPPASTRLRLVRDEVLAVA